MKGAFYFVFNETELVNDNNNTDYRASCVLRGYGYRSASSTNSRAEAKTKLIEIIKGLESPEEVVIK